MSPCAIHVSDLHVGRGSSPGSREALGALAEELRPEVILATGDLSHRGTAEQLAEARGVFAGLSAPLVSTPGNHDIPYRFPSRFTRPWACYEASFGPTDLVHESGAVVVCALNSVRPWRRESGRLSVERLDRVAAALERAEPGALRVVAFHHHLAGAPWRGRKKPLADRDQVLARLVAAGAELVVGGHVHQGSVVERHEIRVVDDPGAPIVLATAPALGRPRPQRHEEARGLHVYRWDEAALTVETRIWDGAGFAPTARRTFPRGDHALRAFG